MRDFAYVRGPSAATALTVVEPNLHEVCRKLFDHFINEDEDDGDLDTKVPIILCC